MKKHAPTIEYQLNQLQLMNDNTFSQLENIANAIWRDYKSVKSIIEKYDITDDQAHSIIDITNSMIIGLLRGDTTEKGTIQKFTDSGLSKERSEKLLSVVQSYKDEWYSTLMFSNLQDVYLKIRDIEEQNRAILSSIKDIIKLLNAKLK